MRQTNHDEMLEKRIAKASRDIARDLISSLAPNPPTSIIGWIEKTAGFTPDPYQIDPLEEVSSAGSRDITIVAVEQIGKSEIWRSYLLYRLTLEPCTAMIVYPSDDLAADENRDRLEPRMADIPALAAELDRPKTSRKDAYHFTDSTAYFTGAGTPLLARSIEVAIADEVDFWVGLTNEDSESKQSMRAKTNVSNLANLWKRTRTFRDRRKLIAVCSPTLTSAPIWQRFLRGTQGYWHWRCLQCGELTPSHFVSRLQFERDEEGGIISGSCRLVCEHCGREHVESEAVEMNRLGQYVHKFPDRSYKSYQVGALACTRAIGFEEVAEAIVAGGARGTTSDQKILDNSFRGMPFQPRKAVGGEDIESFVEKRAGVLSDDMRPTHVFASVDTQDDCFYAILRGVLPTGQTIGCGAKRCETIEQLETFTKAVTAGIIDEGGHRCAEVVQWVQGQQNWWTYKGDSRVKSVAGWKHGGRKQLILANPYHFQGELLSLMHLQTNVDAADYWALPEGMEGYPDNYLDQLLSLQPNSRKRYGHEYKNWTPEARDDHFFDAEKMLLVILRVAARKIKTFDAPDWIKTGKSRRRYRGRKNR